MLKFNIRLPLAALAVATSGFSLAQPVVHEAIAAQSNTPAPSELPATPIPAVCYKQFLQLTKTVLPVELTEVKLDDQSSLYDFGKGPQAYLLIELPKYTKPYHFSVRNIPQAPGFYNRRDYTQIAMRIETFDDDFVSKRLYKHDSIKKRGLGFDKTVFINPSNQSERYVLIYGDLKAAPESSTVSGQSIITPTAIGVAVLFVVLTRGTVQYNPNTAYKDGEDLQVSLVASDKGILVVESKGLEKDK
jgi:hypothetical protein